MQEPVLLDSNLGNKRKFKMADQDKKPTQEELLKAVADVIDEALVEYDELTKTQGQGIDYAQAMDDKKGDGPKASGPDGSTGEGSGAADNSGAGAMVKEDDKEKDKDKKKDKESDEDLKRSYDALVSKMEARGLMAKVDVAKSETATQEAAPVKVAEAAATIVAPVADTSAIDSLRKSYDEKFEAFGKTLGAIGDSVKKIAAQPAAPRKGLTGAKPLRKSEEEAGSSLKKGEVVNRLLDLKKSGDRRLEGAGGSSLINRVETERLHPADIERIKSILK
jgi:hypothetical protein